eukprot:gnl/TRDRNA2_/TRDRNA2_176870_c1_seq4.p1 gnl/TRDRNA2_/TRDRNA2_176870_c1~~gnl/TRDRNA2_/TRDRNA2_176870_c1_seq4.p1  ORF type:complete len:627 (+),score=91.00 gnl/TRDRNA2_/TRDRNA2_176870_c1_seq4:108-1988(+)
MQLRGLFSIVFWQRAMTEPRNKDVKRVQKKLMETMHNDKLRLRMDISLSGSDLMCNKTVDKLARSLPPSIQELKINLSGLLISNSSLLFLADSLPATIQDITFDLSGCTGLTEAGLIGLRSKLPSRLKAIKLIVNGCLVSDEMKERCNNIEAFREWRPPNAELIAQTIVALEQSKEALEQMQKKKSLLTPVYEQIKAAAESEIKDSLCNLDPVELDRFKQASEMRGNPLPGDDPTAHVFALTYSVCEELITVSTNLGPSDHIRADMDRLSREMWEKEQPIPTDNYEPGPPKKVKKSKKKTSSKYKTPSKLPTTFTAEQLKAADAKMFHLSKAHKIAELFGRRMQVFRDFLAWPGTEAVSTGQDGVLMKWKHFVESGHEFTMPSFDTLTECVIKCVGYRNIIKQPLLPDVAQDCIDSVSSPVFASSDFSVEDKILANKDLWSEWQKLSCARGSDAPDLCSWFALRAFVKPMQVHAAPKRGKQKQGTVSRGLLPQCATDAAHRETNWTQDRAKKAAALLAQKQESLSEMEQIEMRKHVDECKVQAAKAQQLEGLLNDWESLLLHPVSIVFFKLSRFISAWTVRREIEIELESMKDKVQNLTSAVKQHEAALAELLGKQSEIEDALMGA